MPSMNEGELLLTAERVLQQGAERVGQKLDPGDDWQPVMIAVDRRGRGDVVQFVDWGPTMEDRHRILEDGGGKRARKHNARVVGIAMAAYLRIERLDEPGGPGPRQEIVNVIVVSRDRVRISYAHVTRHPGRRPELGPWEPWPEDADTAIGGEFPRILRGMVAVEG